MKRWASTRSNGPAAALLLAVTVTWEAAGRIFQVPEYILPLPSAIWTALAENHRLLMGHTGVTLMAVAGGLALAVTVALTVALVMNHWEALKKALYPLLVISQAIPIFALAPVLLIWFGAGLAPKILIVALVCFFPLAVNLVEGLDQIDPEALELMRSIRAGRWLTLRAVKLPSAMPYFFSGLKIAATYSVLGAIIGEWLAARAGLGIYMLRAMHSFRASHLFAAIAVVIVLSLTLFKLVELTAWLAMPWQRKPEEEWKA